MDHRRDASCRGRSSLGQRNNELQKQPHKETKEIKIMKTKFYWVALLASAALIGQAQAGGPHGGGGGMGGGFGGRGFSGGGHVVGGGIRAAPGGGGFRGGGFHAAAPAFSGMHRSVGVAARGGGVGFGMPRYPSVGARPLSRRPVYYNGRVGRSVTPSIGAGTAVSQPQNRFGPTRNPVGQRPAAASNRAANASAVRSPGAAVHRGLNGRTDHIAERHYGNWHR